MAGIRVTCTALSHFTRITREPFGTLTGEAIVPIGACSTVLAGIRIAFVDIDLAARTRKSIGTFATVVVAVECGAGSAILAGVRDTP